ncbi:putative LPS assembly protein LptD [Flavobacterium sp. TH16-21]|uniref:LPS assembly protein LptD n=1 Tax=Flavobacterium lacisediminis TaxID=2989705 RepID=A0ABT3EJI7_9FLAO|nr:putative LPS assembly protein LptD [Flavobacterium lacisediminis]MCW1148736.1 putative LPS assembly protein LptD [Flavobacterium lacisediminis]
MTLQKVSQIFTKILLKALHTKLFHIVFSVIFLTLGTTSIFSQENPIPGTITLTKSDLEKVKDSTAVDSTKKKKTFLEGVVNMKAKEYEKLDQKKKTVTLNDEAEIYYTDFELKAGKIVLDYEKNQVYAGRLKDSAGNYIQRPVFKQGSNIIEPDSIIYNTKSQRAKVWNSRTTQGELFIKAEISKKENDSVYFMKNARMTTSKNIDDPEYYFLVRKVKFVPKKKVVAGLTNMVIMDVPTPIGLPFAYFPMSEKSLSGFILPTPGQNNRQGYFLQNGGYYFALSDYYDLAILGDYYTNGSYGLRAESSYAKRYKFNGRLNFRFENNIQSEKGFPDYIKSKQYNIQWSHSQDAKAAADSRFSASVNLGSSQYFRQSVNMNNVGSSLNNNLSSSVSYSKTFRSVPQVNMSISATHSQNTNTEEIDMTLPTFQASVDRIYPFAPKDGIKKGILKNINLQYNVRGENRIKTNDSLFFTSQMFRDAKSGFQHTIPINTNFKIFKYFSVSAGATYNETWVMNTINKDFSGIENKVIVSDVKGFEAYRTYNFNAGIGTTIYGTFNFGEDKKIQAIRHVMRPNIGYGYTPSFDQYFEKYALDATGINFNDYTKFENGLFGSPSKSLSNRMNFSLSNTFEAKVRDEESKKGETKKVMLLNNLNVGIGYDIAADSLKWSEMSVSGGTQLLKQKMNINFAATLDAFAIDNAGRRIDKLNIDNGGSFFRLPRANMTINYNFSSADNSKKSRETEQNLQNGGRADDLFGKSVDMSDSRQSLFDKDKEEGNKSLDWYSYKIPWDLRLAYSVTYNNTNRQNEIQSHSLMASGNIELAPRWKVGFSSGYDFKQKGVTFTQLRFERDLESWRMSFNWVPFGQNTYWGFFIGISSSIFSDIKYEKRQLPDRVFR